MEKTKNLISLLKGLDTSKMYNDDFLLTWEKSDEEVRATFAVADILRGLREDNVSTRIFDSGLAISFSAIIRRGPASASPAPRISSAWRFRISTKANRRSRTAKPFAKPRT